MPGRIHPLIVFALTLVVYGLTMPRAITLEDAGLFQMVCHLDGIAHPPGYPLFTLLCQPLSWFPHVVNGNLLSAVFASMTAALFHQVCLRLMNDRIFAYVAALAYGFSATFWSQAIIIEVYTLATLMFVVCWWLLLEFKESRRLSCWFGFSLAYGLSLSNHWPLMMLSTPALLIMMWPAREFLFERLKDVRFWLVSLACFVLGLAPYITLVIDSDPLIALYGGIDSLQEFVKYVTRAYYSDHHPTADIIDKFLYALWLLKTSSLQFGWLGIPVLAVGIIFSVRSIPSNLNLALLFIYLGTTFILLMLIGFEYREISKAVFKPYPVIAWLALAFWFALGVTTIGGWVGRYAAWAPGAIAVACIAIVLLGNYGKNNRSASEFVSRYGYTILNALPRDAVLFVQGDYQTGTIGYLHHVRKVRPDIELRHWDGLVFKNRLGSPFASTAELDKAAQEYVNETDRLVFSLNPLFSSSVDFGIYHQAALNDEFGFVTEGEEFLDYLLTLYLEGYINDTHEKYFAYGLLLAYSKQYAGYAVSLGSEDMPEARQKRLDKLQLTFPGRMITMQVLIEEDPNRGQLLEIARLAESDIPEFLPPVTRAKFYELYGRIHLMEPANPEKAIHYFGLSIDLYPAADNGSICRIIRTHERGDSEGAISELQNKFPELEC